MELYLLRHAIAEEPSAARYSDDSLRPLTPEGIEKMRQAAAGAKKLELEIDLILSSPFVRAKQTAEIFAAPFAAAKKIKLTSHLEPTAPFQTLIAELNQKYSDRKQIVLVGHEPFLSRFFSQLLSGDTAIKIDFKKGALAKLTVDRLIQNRCATLDWFLTPKQLRTMS